MSRELNLVPQVNSNTKGTVKSSKTIVLILLLVFVFVGGSFGYVFAKDYLLNKKAEALKTELALSNAKIMEKDELEKQINATKNQIAKAKQLKELKKIDTDGLINRLYALLQKNEIKVIKIQYKAGSAPKIEVVGTAPNHLAAEKMWASLRESEEFVDSQINNWSGQGEIAFTLSITAKEGSANEKQN